MALSDMHKYILRSVASRGVLTNLEIEDLISRFPENAKTPIEDIVRSINNAIKPFQQKLKYTTDEATEKKILVFLSLGFDEATKANSIFSENHKDYFRIIIEDIMIQERRQITGIQALNLVSKLKSAMSKTDAQRLLDTWCHMYYLEKTENSYNLGVRAIHEFEGYLRQNMPNTIEECSLCKQIVFRGYDCPACTKAVHTRCLNQYLQNMSKWPCCKVDFDASQLQDSQGDSSQVLNSATMSQVYDTMDQDMAQSQDEQFEDNLLQESTSKTYRARKRRRE